MLPIICVVLICCLHALSILAQLLSTLWFNYCFFSSFEDNLSDVISCLVVFDGFSKILWIAPEPADVFQSKNKSITSYYETYEV